MEKKLIIKKQNGSFGNKKKTFKYIFLYLMFT